MQAAAITSRFLTGRSSKPGFADSESVVGNDDLLRDIVAGHLIQAVSSRELFLKLTGALIQFAEHAYVRRDLNALEDVSRVLMNLPIDAARQIGLYYQALVVKRRGEMDAAQMLLETVADNAPLNYRARAIQGLGANYHDKGQLNEALRFQVEALRIASPKNAHGLQTMLMAHFEIAIVRSLAGDHNGALSQFEKLWPIVNFIARQNSYYFYYFHNELAVELGELGRLEEAEAACKVALASPSLLLIRNGLRLARNLRRSVHPRRPRLSRSIGQPKSSQRRGCCLNPAENLTARLPLVGSVVEEPFTEQSSRLSDSFQSQIIKQTARRLTSWLDASDPALRQPEPEPIRN